MLPKFSRVTGGVQADICNRYLPQSQYGTSDGCAVHRCKRCGHVTPMWRYDDAGVLRYTWWDFVCLHIRHCDPQTFELIFGAKDISPQSPNHEVDMGVDQPVPSWCTGTLGTAGAKRFIAAAVKA